MAKWSDSIVLKVVNVVVWLALFGSNTYASSVGGAGKETYVTPAPWAFYVWTVINFLLLGLVILQFTEAGHEPVVDGIGWRFAGVGLLNAVFASAFARHHNIIAFVVAIFLAIVLSHIYYTLQTIKPQTQTAKLLVHLPFSLWHAESLVLLVVSFFAAFGKSTHSHAGIFTDVFAIIALGFLSSTSVGYAFSSGGKGDIAGAFVIAWNLLAIFTARTHPLYVHLKPTLVGAYTSSLIHWFALGAFIVSAFSVIKALVFAFRGDGSVLASDGERAPLVAGTD